MGALPVSSHRSTYMRKQLKRLTVSPEVFNKILAAEANYLNIVEDLQPYIYGYPNKYRMVVHRDKYGTDYLILREMVLAKYIDYVPSTTWKQIIIICGGEDTAYDYKEDVSGHAAWVYIMKLLKKYYSEDEIYQCLYSHTAVYDDNKKQIHFNYWESFLGSDYVLEILNCKKYDINGAHCEALAEIFPKASEAIIKLYVDRKKKPIYKAYANYFVGYLTRKGFRGTYNWIVQRTSAKLMKLIELLDGKVIYANTDGVVIKDPKVDLPHSDVLGEFKLEYEGTVYVHKGENYWCYQAGDTISGSIRNAVRDKVDLSKGLTVSYKWTNEVGKPQEILGLKQEIKDVITI